MTRVTDEPIDFRNILAAWKSVAHQMKKVLSRIAALIGEGPYAVYIIFNHTNGGASDVLRLVLGCWLYGADVQKNDGVMYSCVGP